MPVTVAPRDLPKLATFNVTSTADVPRAKQKSNAQAKKSNRPKQCKRRLSFHITLHPKNPSFGLSCKTKQGSNAFITQCAATVKRGGSSIVLSMDTQPKERLCFNTKVAIGMVARNVS